MLGIGTGIMNAAGAGAGGGGGAQFDPCASLPGAAGSRLILDMWDETALVYGNGGGTNSGYNNDGSTVSFLPSKDRFSTWDTWANLVATVTEEVTDPTLDTPGNWTTSGCTISGGAATFSGTSGAYFEQDTTISSLTGSNEWYLVTVTLSSYTSGRIEVTLGSGSVINRVPVAGENYFWLRAQTGGTNKLRILSDISANELTAVVSDVSCKRIPGNHMFITTNSNSLSINTDGNGIKYLSGTSDGMYTGAIATIPPYLGVMLMGQANDVAQSSYDSFFAIQSTNNLAFGNNPTPTGGANFEMTLNTPGTTEQWRAGAGTAGSLDIWELQLDWTTTDAYQIWKNNASQTTGTLSVGTSLTDTPASTYRLMTSGNGVDELNGFMYGLYCWEADGTQLAGFYDWLNSNTGSTL